jgi:hypothetical protein
MLYLYGQFRTIRKVFKVNITLVIQMSEKDTSELLLQNRHDFFLSQPPCSKVTHYPATGRYAPPYTYDSAVNTPRYTP